jgi:putative hydrolase of the HAD superfamily
MRIKAIAFDVHGTLVKVRTDDHSDESFRALGHALSYQGIELHRRELRELYRRYAKEQRRASPEHHPEWDAVAVWRRIVDERATDFTRALPSEKREYLPLLLAETHRGIARHRLRLYPHVRPVLNRLVGQYPLALITDAQSAHARAELNQVGLLDYFDPIVISGDHGFRKPGRRLFGVALDRLGVNPENTLFVGNDVHRDIHGAQRIGMRTALFHSDQGKTDYRGCRPDFTIKDHRELLAILGLDHSRR